MEPQTERESLVFSVPVRGRDVKAVKLSNPSGVEWRLRPVFDHEFFSGAAEVVVPAGESVGYEVTYAPLTMSKSHAGTLFVALPDGQGLLVPLTGTASAPKPHKAAAPVEVVSKRAHVERIAVANWLGRAQRFRVQIQRGKTDPATLVHGAEFFEVPAAGEREYELHVFAYREGVATVEVTFLNEASGEYVTHELSFRSTAPEVLGTVVLEAVVRQAVSHTLRLSNPLAQAVTVTMTCVLGGGGEATGGAPAKGAAACTEVHGPSTFKLPARSQDVAFTFEYLPLVPRPLSARLVLSSTELGQFPFQLELTGRPAPPQPPIQFSASLGEAVVKRCRLTTFAPARTDMAISIQPPDAGFAAPASVSAPPALKTGAELAFDVTFEPRRLGDVRATLVVSSPSAGEYVCPLVAACTPPGPSGPHGVRAGGKLTLPFKNVLPAAETFAVAVDNAAFSAGKDVVIKAGDTKEIVIKHDGSTDSGDKALLTITCTTGPLAGTVWPYYLAVAATSSFVVAATSSSSS